MAQRIKGQEVEVGFTRNGVPVTLTCIKDFDVTFEQDQLSEGYLGETAERQDSIFKRVTMNMSVHHEDGTGTELIDALVQKSQRRRPGDTYTIKAVLNFPNGQRVRYTFSNVEFGGLPLSFGSRAAYGETKITGACSTYRRIGAA